MTAAERAALANQQGAETSTASPETSTASPGTIPRDPGIQDTDVSAEASPAGTSALAERPRAAAPMTANAKLADYLIFADKKDGFVVDYGTLPRIKADNGEFYDNEDRALGKIIKFQVMSYNTRWTITPSDKAAPTELLKFSLDGEYLDDGSGIRMADHLADLKKNWPKARAAEYLELIVNLVETEAKSNLVGNLVQLQLSPTSKKEFESFRLQTSFKMTQGLLNSNAADLVMATAKKATNANKESWTKFIFSCAV